MKIGCDPMKKWMILSGVMTVFGLASVMAAAPFAAAVEQDGHWGAINGENKKIIPPIYDKVDLSLEKMKNGQDNSAVYEDASKNNELGLIEVSKGSIRGFYDRDGQVIVPVSYDRRSAWSNDRLMVRVNGKYGYYYKDGTVIAPPMYDGAAVYCDGLAGVGRNGRYGFIDDQGKTVIPFNYDEVCPFQEGRAVVCRAGKWGAIDKSGTEIIPCQYDDMQHEYVNGYVGIRKGDVWGFADASGAVAIVPQFLSLVGGFHEGVAVVETKDGHGFVDTSGHIIITGLSDVYTQFSEGLAAVRQKNGKKGYIDKTGAMVIATDYSRMGPFTNGLAEYGRSVTRTTTGGAVAITLGGSRHTGAPVIMPSMDRSLGVGIGVGMGPDIYDDWYPPYGGHWGRGVHVGTGIAIDKTMKRGYIDPTGKVVISAQLDAVYPLSDTGALVENQGHWGYVRRDGTYMIPAIYEAMFKDDDLNLFLAKDKDGHWGALSAATGKNVIPCQYEGLQPAGDVLAYKQGKKWGVVNGDGTVITAAQYSRVGAAADSLVPVKTDKTWSYLGLDGKPAFSLPAGTTEAGTFTNGYAPIRVNGKWGIINTSGQVTVAPQYKKMNVLS